MNNYLQLELEIYLKKILLIILRMKEIDLVNKRKSSYISIWGWVWEGY